MNAAVRSSKERLSAFRFPRGPSKEHRPIHKRQVPPASRDAWRHLCEPKFSIRSLLALLDAGVKRQCDAFGNLSTGHHGWTNLRIIFLRAAFSVGHASITRSSMSSSDIFCLPRGAVAFLDAFGIDFSESLGFTES
jgi:hypothetical protein